MSSSPDFARALELLRGARDVVICGHVSPDGDCLGSALGLSWSLRALGKQVTCLLAAHDPLDAGLLFLPGIDECVVADEYAGAADLFVAVDVPKVDRMGDAAARIHAATPTTLTIDHHLSDAPFSQVNYIDSDSPAAAMLVWSVARALGPVDERIATCCYTGLLTDTGRFQYQNTTPAAFEAAFEMMQAGADPSSIAREVYQNRSRQSLALEQRMLSRIKYLGKGQFAMSYLTRADFVETGAVKADAEPLIDVMRSVRGSLRAKDETDVAQIAARFGGGGHKAAAGFTYEGSLEAVLAQVEQIFSDMVE